MTKPTRGAPPRPPRGPQPGIVPLAYSVHTKPTYKTHTHTQMQATAALCQHVLQRGAAAWDAAAAPLRVAPRLAALKWHALCAARHQRQQAQARGEGLAPAGRPKWYSDWELCVLLVVSRR